LYLRFLLHGGTYSPPKTLLLDLSGPLGGPGGEGRQRGEGRRKEEGKKGKGRDRKRRSGLSPLIKIPEDTHASIYY